MKSFILLSAITLLSNAMASECAQQEAQFKGVVVHYSNYQDDYAQIGECNFQIAIELKDFKPSQVEGCALDYSEVLKTTFEFDYYHTPGLVTCPVDFEGQEISGYLVKRNNNITLE